jgi:uncharacterized membrane protein
VRIPRSVLVVRLSCLTAMAVSAALVAESMHPERGFCPLQAACEKARHSALGNVLGVPTSVLGIFAFSTLFLLTLLPPRPARMLARPAAWIGALAAAGLVGYQAFELHSFCPLCLIVDASALAAGAGAFGWPKLPPGLSGRAIEDEHISVRLRWALGALLVLAAPMAWPRPAAKPGWVEIPTAEVDEPEPEAEVAAVPIPEIPKLEVPDGGWKVATPRFDEYRAPAALPSRIEGGASHAEPASALVVVESSPPAAPSPATSTPSAPPATSAPVAPPTPKPVASKPQVRAIPVVLYLNAFCAHCRATHARLEEVLASFGAPVRVKRVYVWASEDIPYWAWACAAAGTVGLEDQVFAELLRARNDRPDQVQGAAIRAGLDPAVLASAIGRGDLRARLERDHHTVLSARIEGLPTLDIGRRRLMGEQSEEEILDALQAARSGR